MTTKKQYADQCRAENPKPVYATINGSEVLLTDDEYETMVENFAQMRYEQNEFEQEAQNKNLAKQAILDKLGLTADEVAALIQ